MSVKSDKWIRRQCSQPVAMGSRGEGWIDSVVIENGQEVMRASGLPPLSVCRGVDIDQSINDTWKPMIEPFAPYQIKYKGGALCEPPPADAAAMENWMQFEQRSYRTPLEKIISYGTSSYGYDLRVGNRFKIFTNINSTVVDPKNFDEKNFVDFEGDVCIIPPNSFALASSVEYFRIPRDILTVCLGKSTYARCFTGDTRVALVDGTSTSFVELEARAAKGERFWGYSTSPAGTIEVAELTAPRKIGHERVLEVELDNGEKIRCTPDHKFMMRGGEYVEAQHLQPGSSLMPLYRGEYRGYESVYQPNFGRMISTHWLADMWNVREGIYADSDNTHRHHNDHVRRNNNPTNIVRMKEDEHLAHHNDIRWSEPGSRKEHGLLIVEAFGRLADDSDWYEHFCSMQSIRAKAFWTDDKYADQRERLRQKQLSQSDETRAKRSDAMRTRFADQNERDAHSDRMKAAWKDDAKRREHQGIIARMINLRDEITEAVVENALKLAGSIRGAARYLDCDRSVFRRFPNALSNFYNTNLANNHKVVAVREVEGTHDVYCLTVPEFGNFALESGVFVKNCGIIVNVTPFEPEWEGHVTLEFSNTTPLPARIYAYEGVAQVVFLGADEVCETSYKDRQGKYMNQSSDPIPPKV